MMQEPINLTSALASFEEIYSPRIVARVNDYDVRVAHVPGDHVWHVHDDTDEFFLVIDGRFDIAIRDDDGRERSVVLGPARAGGDVDHRRPPRRRHSRLRPSHRRRDL